MGKSNGNSGFMITKSISHEHRPSFTLILYLFIIVIYVDHLDNQIPFVYFYVGSGSHCHLPLISFSNEHDLNFFMIYLVFEVRLLYISLLYDVEASLFFPLPFPQRSQYGS